MRNLSEQPKDPIRAQNKHANRGCLSWVLVKHGGVCGAFALAYHPRASFSLIDHRKQETTLRTSVRRFAKRARHTTTVNRSVQFPVLKTGLKRTVAGVTGTRGGAVGRT